MNEAVAKLVRNRIAELDREVAAKEECVAQLKRERQELHDALDEGDGHDDKPKLGPWVFEVGQHVRKYKGGTFAYVRDGNNCVECAAFGPDSRPLKIDHGIISIGGGKTFADEALLKAGWVLE